MMHKSARMTAKARKARLLVGELNQVAENMLRRDREAIDMYYAILTARGYEWQPAQQEWAFVPDGEEQDTFRVTFAMLEVQREELTYVLVEALKQAGYAARVVDVVASPFEPGVTMTMVEVKP